MVAKSWNVRPATTLALLVAALGGSAGCNDNDLRAGGSDRSPGAKPVAVIDADGPLAATTAILDGGASYDPDDPSDGAIVDYRWSIVEAPAGADTTLGFPGPSTVEFSTAASGTYVAELVVVDRDGLESDPARHALARLQLSIDGDCVSASCPAEAPYPAACEIVMDGGDERGCVASVPDGPTVYFQEGDACGAGHVGGTLSCASEPADPLSETTCPINKPQRFYPAAPDGCPATN